MECFQTDSEIGFQFLPSDKLSPVANYSHCQLTLQPALSEGRHEPGCQICFCPSRQQPWWKQTAKSCAAAYIRPNIIVPATPSHTTVQLQCILCHKQKFPKEPLQWMVTRIRGDVFKFGRAFALYKFAGFDFGNIKRAARKPCRPQN